MPSNNATRRRGSTLGSNNVKKQGLVPRFIKGFKRHSVFRRQSSTASNFNRRVSKLLIAKPQILEEQRQRQRSSRRDTFYTCGSDMEIDLEDVEMSDSPFVNSGKRLVTYDSFTHESPVLLSVKPSLIVEDKFQLLECGEGDAYNLPFNTQEIEFESNLFKGKILFRFKSCKDYSKDYFRGRNRKLQWVVQGQFKQTINCNDVVTGYEMDRKFVNIPAKVIIKNALKIFHRIAPTFQEDIFAKSPYIINPFLQTVQTLDISLPGQEPHLFSHEFKENNSSFFGTNLNRMDRKQFFAKADNACRYSFDPKMIYTFEIYEDKLDVSTFKMNLPFMSFDLSKYLDSQPIPFMAKVLKSPRNKNEGEYLFAFEIFNRAQFDVMTI